MTTFTTTRPIRVASTPMPAAATSTIAGRALDFVEAAARRVAASTVRLALAVIMLWFGVPKLIPGASPAEDIAVDTVAALTGGLIAGDLARLMVGGLEVVIGTALVVGRAMPLVLLVILGHMAGTFAPLVLFPDLTWHGPGVGTLEGQYILKNVVILACVVVLAAYGMRRGRTAKR
jgi:putative oxidoreductase